MLRRPDLVAVWRTPELADRGGRRWPTHKAERAPTANGRSALDVTGQRRNQRVAPGSTPNSPIRRPTNQERIVFLSLFTFTLEVQ